MIKLIVAMDKNNLIGKNGSLPWHYSKDLKFFKRSTLNHTIVMGEETLKSILAINAQPLKNRHTVVATLTGYTYPGIETTNNIIEYLKNTKEDVYICGGKTIYLLTYKMCDELLITYIDKEHDGDTYLDLDLSGFYMVEEHIEDEILHFRRYIKK